MVRKTKMKAPPVAEQIREAAFKDGRIEMVPIDAVKAYERNARTHDEKQTTVIMASMREFGFVNPVLVDADNVIVAGHGRVQAARQLGITHVPVLRIAGLTPDQLRAYRLADNRIAELAGWDEDILAIELQYLVELDEQVPIEVLGWNGAEIDIKLDASGTGGGDPAAEDIPALEPVAVSRVGDLWLLGRHRLLCGSALLLANYDLLLRGEQVDFVCQDPPWNIKINSIVGSGKTQFREFLMGSGEMSDAGFRQFLYDQLACNRDRAKPGAILQVFIDWRGVEKVIAAGLALGLEHINVCVWSKGGGMGSPWRSGHELVVVFRNPGGPTKDRVQLGRYGRYRTNVWEVPGQNSFGKHRMEALQMHPTSKPVALLTEAIRDVTDRGDILLDSFMGSGSLLIAAEKTGRTARGMELDPLYVDTIVRRWQAFTNESAILEGLDRTFGEVEAERCCEKRPPVRQRTRPGIVTPFTEGADDE